MHGRLSLALHCTLNFCMWAINYLTKLGIVWFVANIGTFSFCSTSDAFNLLSFSQLIVPVVESQEQVQLCVESIIPVVSDAMITIVTVPQSATGILYSL